MIKLRSHHTLWADISPYGEVHLTRENFDVTINYMGKTITARMPKEVEAGSLFDTITTDEIRFLIEKLEG